MVMVFYEALCPDSKHFILKQLQPTYTKASTIMDFQLIPYGKATVCYAFAKCLLFIMQWMTYKITSFYSMQTNTNRDGSLVFDCQHGPVECEANIYHACTIEAVNDQRVLLDMISCMIANNYRPKEAMISCAKENKHLVDYEQIQKCYDSPHGAELLKLHGMATNALRPQVNMLHYRKTNQRRPIHQHIVFLSYAQTYLFYLNSILGIVYSDNHNGRSSRQASIYIEGFAY